MMDSETQQGGITVNQHIKVLRKEVCHYPQVSPETPETAKVQGPRLVINKESLVWIEGAVDNLITAYERGYLRIKDVPSAVEDLEIELLPISDLPPQLGHLTDVKTFETDQQANLWGNSDPNKLTYLQTIDFAVEAYLDSDYMISLENKPKNFYRLYIDTKRLQNLRAIYLDEESICTTPEDFGRSFVVQGGIPKETFSEIELVEVNPRPLSSFLQDESSDTIDGNDDEEWAAKNWDKLQEFLERISQAK